MKIHERTKQKTISEIKGWPTCSSCGGNLVKKIHVDWELKITSDEYTCPNRHCMQFGNQTYKGSGTEWEEWDGSDSHPGMCMPGGVGI